MPCPSQPLRYRSALWRLPGCRDIVDNGRAWLLGKVDARVRNAVTGHLRPVDRLDTHLDCDEFLPRMPLRPVEPEFHCGRPHWIRMGRIRQLPRTLDEKCLFEVTSGSGIDLVNAQYR